MSLAALATALLSPWFAGSPAGVSPEVPPTPEAGGDKLWSARYEVSEGDSGSPEAVAVSPDGRRVFVTGTSAAAYATIAYDSGTGQTIWVRRLDVPASDADYAQAIAVSPNGQTVFVTGNSAEGFNNVFLTVAYVATTGQVRWVSRYGGTPSTGASSIATSPDGSLVFVAGSDDPDRDFLTDYAVVAYEASTGTVRWVGRYDGPEGLIDAPSDLIVSPDGSKVFAAGATEVERHLGTSIYDYATVAFDAATGATLWARTYDGPAHGDDMAAGIAGSPDGSAVFVTGWSEEQDGSSNDAVTIAYDSSTGQERWVRRSNVGENEFAVDLVTSPDGSLVIIGGSIGRPWPETTSDYLTIAYDSSTGAARWARRFDGPEDGDDDVVALAMAPDGSKVFVTGESDGIGLPHHIDYVTIAYDAAIGTRQWLKRYDGPGVAWDEAHAIDVSPDSGKVVITGQSGWTADDDYVTIAYEA